MKTSVARFWPTTVLGRSRAWPDVAGWLLLTVSILSGATFTSFGRQLGGSLSPFSMVFLGESSIAFFLCVSFGIVPLFRQLMRLERNSILCLLAVSALSFAALLLIFAGLQTTQAANAELFGRSELIFTLILAPLFLRESVTKAHIVAGCTIAVGISIVGLRGFQENISLQYGDMAIVAGSFSFSVVYIIAKKYLGHTSAELMLLIRSTLCIAAFLLLSPFLPEPLIEQVRRMPPELLPALIGFGFISRFLSTLSFYEAAERLPLSLISLVTPLGIVVAVFFAHTYLGEILEWYHFIGGGLVVLGVLLLQIIGIHGGAKARLHLRHHYRHI